MVNLQEGKPKEIFITEIVNEINEIPIIYYKTLYAIIHTFKENIPIIQIENQTVISIENDLDFDWDNLLDEIHSNRQRNNVLTNERINHLFEA